MGGAKLRCICLAASVFAIVVAVIAWWLSRPFPARMEAASKSVISLAAPLTTAQHPSIQQTTAPSAIAIRKELLADDWEALKSGAGSGDRKAACLLGFKLLRCASVAAIANDVRLMGDAIPSDLDPPNRVNLLAMRPAARAFVSMCRRAPADSKRSGLDYVRQAALAGEPEAMYRYARGDGIYLGEFGPDTAEFGRWMIEAPSLLEQAFRSGYPPAVVTLWQAYLDDSDPVSQLIPDNPLQA